MPTHTIDSSQRTSFLSPTKTREEIAAEYGVSRRTLYNWLKKLNLALPKGLITPKYQKKIYEALGKPP